MLNKLCSINTNAGARGVGLISSFFFFFLLFFIENANASYGDQSNEFRGCYHTCHFNNCSSEKELKTFLETHPVLLKLLCWTCEDECKYNCIWQVTNSFILRGSNIPQFFGKWPFIRFMGLQEPASVIFSALNFAAQFLNFKKFLKAIPYDAPMQRIWTFYYIICLNAWIWSIIFHARDNEFTEKMDYFCAFSMVLYALFIFLIRISYRRNISLKLFIGGSALAFFMYHIWYLSKFLDYGYNMKVNVTVGVLNGFGWLFWSYNGIDFQPYIFWLRATVVLAGATMLLELLDFAPIFWTFDAHSLWHLSTSFLPFYFYRFMEGDCLYLLQGKQKDPEMKKFV